VFNSEFLLNDPEEEGKASILPERYNECDSDSSDKEIPDEMMPSLDTDMYR